MQLPYVCRLVHVLERQTFAKVCPPDTVILEQFTMIAIILSLHWVLNVMLSVQKLGWQLAGLAAIAGWTAVLSLLMFGSLRLMRVLRVSEEMERKGVWKCWGICNNS